MGNDSDEAQSERSPFGFRSSQGLSTDEIGHDDAPASRHSMSFEGGTANQLTDEYELINVVRVDSEQVRQVDLLQVHADHKSLVRADVVGIPDGVAERPFAPDDVRPVKEFLGFHLVVGTVPLPFVDEHGMALCLEVDDERRNELEVVPSDKHSLTTLLGIVALG